MKTAFLILADEVDITVLLADRLVRLTISDEAGLKSDTAQITIDDRDHILALPATGARLDISFGFEETGLVYLGQFVVDEVTGSSFPNLIEVKAKAADMEGEIRAPKTRQRAACSAQAR
ncbi:hypothetical protein [Falsihalocynthiibacter arcticus]|uniref:hypothetical protein n=1 Tax=Falsihalocynthiibacter arcticus TaxID=1579316 RepID=UPI0030039B2D